MRLLVLGTGSIGMRHLRTLGERPGVSVVAAPVRESRRAQLTAEGVAAVSLEDALRTGVDGAVVATDTGRHHLDAVALLERCPVLVEKPLALDQAAAASVLEGSRRSGHAVSVACCMRFDPGLSWLRARLPRLGTLHAADAECLSWLPAWRPGRDLSSSYAARPGEGGVLLDMIHEVDYCEWLLGPARRVFAQLENRGRLGFPAEVEESAQLLLDHGGVVATLRLSYASRPPSRRLRVWGDEGCLDWDYLARSAVLLDPDGKERERFDWEAPGPMYRGQAEAWIASLTGGDAGPLAPGAEGARAVAACDAARRSARSGGWERVA